MFANRTRPCLLYQIKRCSAPCVGRVSADEYADLIREAKDFLAGRTRGLQARLGAKMQAASDGRDFETAALFRDRIRALTAIQARQDINLEALGDADVIAAHQAAGATCVQVFFFRGGFNYGNRAYFPRHDKQLDASEVLNAFIGQFYADRMPPNRVLLSREVPDRELLAQAHFPKHVSDFAENRTQIAGVGAFVRRVGDLRHRRKQDLQCRLPLSTAPRLSSQS